MTIAQRKGEPVVVAEDEFLRPDTTLEKLGKLKPAFRHDGKGSVTAGNSSCLNDGAAALLVAGVPACAEAPLAPAAPTAAPPPPAAAAPASSSTPAAPSVAPATSAASEM